MTDQKRVVLEGAMLIDGTGTEPLPDSAVVIHGSTIEQVGPKLDVDVPPGCDRVDVSGKTVMPGMFDCHSHPSVTTVDLGKALSTHRTVKLFRTAEMLKRTLHAGFTTIRTAGVLHDVGLREAVEMELLEGPRLVMAGTVGQEGGQWESSFPSGVQIPQEGVELASGVPAVQGAARRQLRKGFDFIKVSTTGDIGSPVGDPEDTEFTVEELKAIVHEATARGKAVMAHAYGSQGIKNAILAGVWSIEHGSMLDDEAIHMLVDSGAYLVPTLFTIADIAERVDEIGLGPTSRMKLEKVKAVYVQSFRRAVAAGVKIGVGTDIIDEASHGKNARELELMVRHGLSSMQAIVAATSTSAEVCRVAHKVGTLEPGKLADLLVVDGNPLDDISMLQDSSRLLLVMKEGKRYVDRL